MVRKGGKQYVAMVMLFHPTECPLPLTLIPPPDSLLTDLQLVFDGSEIKVKSLSVVFELPGSELLTSGCILQECRTLISERNRKPDNGALLR